ncbi:MULTISPECIES: tripartite tricarboxylate transporter substrate binding protein [unclassified Beijerinckia]|uniref:Bug family tripartite tricarboxylate transporter substrate binding protein n=1 Tax=unclassified Beijerinckia TaxID=2638183 RepID=UPI00089BD201|nr:MULTISPECIES: tripartite tricarboxylate transporter substrate binding protein [unclassified Beijerinckia]MDH7797226.1 tripartite-type tricarboxylate transporter receptor subunit TctC [Beijerinckia sp. GAS462]SEC77054.1 Tripartite-type tricarboxylate transporter, receptor component TctC [Beijerinckia sp. 28-YEA-48]
MPMWRGAIFVAALTAVVVPAAAQDYPSRPITLVVPYAAGGPVDIAGRSTAEALSKQLGQGVVVENKPGAGGLVGTRYVGTARPDGYTLLLGSPGPLVIAPSADPATVNVERDFTLIGVIAESPQVLVISSKLPAKTFKEFVAYAKTKPGALNYGSAGIGTTPHLAAELLNRATGIRTVHVPYRGTSAAVPDVISGELQMIFGDIATLRPFVDSKAVTALVIGGTRRSNLLPDVPNAVEEGYPGLISRNFSVLLAPARMPADIVARLNAALTAAKTDKGFIERMDQQGMSPVDSSPDQARQYLQGERQTWEPIVREMGLKF